MAVLLGPSGVGLVGLYTSVTGLVGSLASLGIASSGVREVAEAHGSGDGVRIARTVKILRRACWATGVLGWLLTACLSYPLSIWAFDTSEHAGAVALLGLTLLLTAISNGQKSLIQGTRRIGDLARLSVLGVISGTILAVGLYAWLGERGIIPVLIVSAIANLFFSWWFARRIPLVPVSQSFTETWQQSKRLLGLGLAFMWCGLLVAGVEFITRSLIVRELGLEANGIYQGAWGISGMFGGFILGAMGADFFPRLTAVSHDHVEVNRLVNEQTEIGILLALPGLLATLAFAPWLMHIFYSPKFLPGAALLPWFILGVFGQVVSWPMGFIMLAKGAKGWFAATETSAAIIRLILAISLFYWIGLGGIAIAYPILYLALTMVLLRITKRLTGFGWSHAAWKLLAVSTAMVFSALASDYWLQEIPALIIGTLLAAIASLFSMRGIVLRLGSDHRVVRLACRIPGIRRLCVR